jgi:hypothetical protein
MATTALSLAKVEQISGKINLIEDRLKEIEDEQKTQSKDTWTKDD